MFIEAEKANYPIGWMCGLLGVARSSFYAWRRAAVSPSQQRWRRLGELVTHTFHAFRGVYGCRRIARHLNDAGHPCSIGTVAELMREAGLQAAQPRGYKRTTLPDPAAAPAPDLIGRQFTADAPGQWLVGDITYLHTGQGWLYLATVIDLCTRMVVGWQLADHMRTSLVTDALTMAHNGRHLSPNAVFHSDRGCQYTSAEFGRWCTDHQVRNSVGRTGVCWDNAVAESFFATLKNEMYYRQFFRTRAKARFAVAEYIEVFYNRQRGPLHPQLQDAGPSPQRTAGHPRRVEIGQTRVR